MMGRGKNIFHHYLVYWIGWCEKTKQTKQMYEPVHSILRTYTSYYILVVMRVRMISEEGREKNIVCTKKTNIFLYKKYLTHAFLRTTFYRTSIWFKFLCTYTHNFFNYFVRSVPLITHHLLSNRSYHFFTIS